MAIYRGTPIAPGVAMGPVYIPAMEPPLDLTQGPWVSLEPRAAWAAWRAAATVSLSSLQQNLQGRPEAALVEAQLLMVQDTLLDKEVEARIQKGKGVVEALSQALEGFKKIFSQKSDAYLRERCDEVQGLETGLLRLWSGQSFQPSDLGLKSPSIVVLEQLTSDKTAAMDPEHVLGIISESGSRTSHGAIMARALGIPALLGLPDATRKLQSGALVFLDGDQGVVETELSPERTEACKAACLKAQQAQKARARWARLPGRTRDGAVVTLRGNLAHPEEISKAVEQGIEGVGLMRTEFLFMNRPSLPDEAEQFQTYRALLEAFPHQKVVIRTMDIGGDKPVGGLDVQVEPNPFLGNRGIRYALSHPELLKCQLRALLRASTAGNLHIMLPMVNGLEEVRAVKALMAEAAQALKAEEGLSFPLPPLGIMVETPSAVINADFLAREVDFFSIGSNDLTQYLCAADRSNPAMATYCSPFYPAVVRSLKHVVDCGARASIEVSLCGEIAADSLLLPLLVGLGLRTLSMSPLMVLHVKERLAQFQSTEACAVAKRACAATTGEEIQELLKRFLASAS